MMRRPAKFNPFFQVFTIGKATSEDPAHSPSYVLENLDHTSENVSNVAIEESGWSYRNYFPDRLPHWNSSSQRKNEFDCCV